MDNFIQRMNLDSDTCLVHSFQEIAPRVSLAKHLIAVLHGRSGNAVDMQPLAERISKAIPSASVICPSARTICEVPESPLGRQPPYQRQWFEKYAASVDVQYQQLTQSAGCVRALLDARLAEWGLDRSNLILIGYSQGGYLCLQLGLTLQPSCRLIVGFGCRVLDVERLLSEQKSQPRCTLIHGAQDGILPISVHTTTVQALRNMGVPVVSEVHEQACHNLSDSIQDRIVQVILDEIKERPISSET